MAKQYELYYYQESGISDPVDTLEQVKETLFNETGTNFSLEELEEGAIFRNNEGDLIQISSFEDGASDEEEEEE